MTGPHGVSTGASEWIALNRFGLGARGDDAGSDDVPPGDRRDWLTDQLARFDSAPEPVARLRDRASLIAQVRVYDEHLAERRRARAVPGGTMNEAGDGAGADAQDDPLRQARLAVRQGYVAAVEARAMQALFTTTPFAERLVHFWSNHFAVSTEKLPVLALAGDFEFHAIRPRVMGRFADLAWAAASHPAMLIYLDQAQSVGPDSPRAERGARRAQPLQRAPGLNENLAREIMELHTLGVRSGYDQADVTEFARALTGWTVPGLAGAAAQAPTGDSAFVAARHQPGDRTILGRRYPAAGPRTGPALAPAIVADLAAQPATARHVATKLARHFTADDPPPALVDRLAANFLATGGDLPALYRTLVRSPEPWSPATRRFKSPWDWSISALRASGPGEPGAGDGAERRPRARQDAAGLLQQLGQPVWRPGSPAGWDDLDAGWAGAGALMTRVELAERLANRTGDRVDARSLARAVLPGGALSPATQQAIARADSPAQGLALLLASPDFMWR